MRRFDGEPSWTEFEDALFVCRSANLLTSVLENVLNPAFVVALDFDFSFVTIPPQAIFDFNPEASDSRPTSFGSNPSIIVPSFPYRLSSTVILTPRNL